MKPRHISGAHDMGALQRTCNGCNYKKICLASGLDDDEIAKFDRVMKRRLRLSRSNYLFRSGAPADSIYTVRSGSLKSYVTDEEGREQITNFYLPGEIVGLDALTSNIHPSTVQALESTTICEMPLASLNKLMDTIPTLRNQLIRLMSGAIRVEEDHSMLLGKKTAEQRLASLLLNFASRFHDRGYSSHEFNLSMSRNDMGNYLGLAMETVSRLFSRFQDMGLITVNRKLVHINDLDALHVMVLESSPDALGKGQKEAKQEYTQSVSQNSKETVLYH